MEEFRLTEHPIDPGALARLLAVPEAGAYVSFEGWIRNHNDGRKVLRLEYEVYAPLALSEGQRIVAEARARYALAGVACVHRSGTLEIGECAVWVGASAAHRDAAYAGSRYVIDTLKHTLPIWKKEYYADGEARWVACAHEHAPQA